MQAIKTADDRRAHPQYSEDADDMTLEYLIHSTTKSCIDDFISRSESNENSQPAQSVSTQLHILDDFTQIYLTKYEQRELSDEICLWLELLEIVVFISCRHTDSILFSTSSDPSLLQQRRRHWFSVRKATSSVTGEEESIYRDWDGASFATGLYSNGTLPHAARSLETIIPLFFAVSAKVAQSIDQGISEQWVELAAHFMLQVAVESLLAPGDISTEQSPLIAAFAWGWVPVEYWKDYDTRDEAGADAETMINSMFEDKNEKEQRENSMWQRARLRHLLAFDVSESSSEQSEERLAKQLEHLVAKYPIQQFEQKLMEFLKAIWFLFRKPLLVQIEDGYIEGITEEEFRDFKRKVFSSA